MLAADVLAVLVAASLPWSTSAVGIFITIWILTILPTFRPREFLRGLTRPASALPLALFVLSLIGMLWSESPWADRIRGISPVAKLLVVPLLLYHFERSRRGLWVFYAFLVSCVLLMTLSWIVLYAPWMKLTATASDGVPVKNYIDQSQEFALCLFALAPIALQSFERRQYGISTAAGLIMVGFFTNMMFAVSARTALIYMPAMLILFAALYLNRRTSAVLFAAATVLSASVWLGSPYLRTRVSDVFVEYHYYEQNIARSTGQRLEYWRKSLKFFVVAPMFGNGTGSTKLLFERDAIDKVGLSAEVIGNPHNQTLNVAVQWGLVGVSILYAMWLFHLLLFRVKSWPAYVGLLVVVQNMVSSLLNSHLFDFHEGWMYVLGVGVAGGMMRRDRSRAKEVRSAQSSARDAEYIR